jgi:hypothetical protein
MTDLAKLYRMLAARGGTATPDADTLARMAAVRGAHAGGASAEAAIVALARELEADSAGLVRDLRGPVVVPFRARLRANPWVPAALAAGVAVAAVLLVPARDEPAVPEAPVAQQAPAADDTLFAVSFDEDATVAQAGPADGAPVADEVFSGDFDS